MESFVHVAQVRFTPGQWRVLLDMALIRRITVEDLIREELEMPAGDAAPPPERHLRLVDGEQ
jgi:hypothetical protein